jgi:hypothetical protein
VVSSLSLKHLLKHHTDTPTSLDLDRAAKKNLNTN